MFSFLKRTKKLDITHYNLIPYIVCKDHIKLKKYIQEDPNRNKARRELVNLKYVISSLEPLFYDILVTHSEKINNGYIGPCETTYKDTATGKEGFFSVAYKFNSIKYNITFGKSSKCILYKENITNELEYGGINNYSYKHYIDFIGCINHGLKIELSDLQYKVMCELQKYCELNQKKIEEFKKESSLQKILQMR